MAEGNIYKIDKLSYDNWNSWSFRVKLLLAKEGCLEVIEKTPPNPTTEAWQKKENKAYEIIGLSLDDSQLIFVKDLDGKGSKAWQVLKDHHQRTSAGAKIRVIKRLFTSKLQTGGSMREHLGKMLVNMDQLREMDVNLPEEVAVAAVLASLNKDYDGLVTALEAWDDSKLKMFSVKGKLIEEWEKRQAASSQSQMATPSTTLEQKEAREDHGKAFKRRHNFRCHNCGEEGHFRADCPRLNKMEDLRNMLNKKESAKMARFKTLYTNKFFNSEKNWVIDSGASSHMCAHKEMFHELDENHRSTVITASGQKVTTGGVGKVKVQLYTRNGPFLVEFKDVLYVKELDENLISVKKIVERGFQVEFDKYQCYVKSGTERMTLGKIHGNLWMINEYGKCFRLRESEEYCIHEWHRRLAHRNLNDIRKMEGTDFKIRKCEHTDDCEACIKGKMSRRSFPKEAKPARNVMDCVVSDVCGPLQVESLGRKRYFVTFIDVYSHHCKVYFIREKSEVPRIAMEYIEFVKTQIGRKPKTLRTDRGTEYLNNQLQSYLKQEGIKFECTVGYAPEQNGIAERKNRTLMEATRSMLAESSLPKSFWAEALDTANNVFNRLIDRNTRKSPHELMFEEKPKETNFYEFGMDAFIMIPYEKRRKLDDKAHRMKFIGYSETSKGLRFTDRNFKVHTSREYHFMDTKEKFNKRFHRIIPCNNSNVSLEECEFTSNAAGEDENIGNEELPPQEVDEHDHVEGNEDPLQQDIPDDMNEELPELEQEQEVIREEPQVRHSTRGNMGTMPKHFEDFEMYHANMKEDFEPSTYMEAITCKESKEWKKAMDAELNAIEENETWELTALPKGRKAIGSKWVFKIKRNEDGLKIYKARLVAQGFTQRYGIDYDEVFAPVTRASTFRLLLSVAGMRHYIVNQYDIKTAFLNGKLNEEIYMKQPVGYEKGNEVYKLKKSIYGLKQAAHVWNQTLHEVLMRNGCIQNESDKCLYKKKNGDKVCYLIIHVDDMLVASSDEEFQTELMTSIGNEFELKKLGNVKQYLGIDVERRNGEFFISQEQHIEKIIREAGLEEAKESAQPMDTGYYKLEGKELESNTTYRKLIGMLLYLSTNTRPDISACVSILSRKVEKPRDCDLVEVKRLIRYLKGSKALRLRLNSEGFENKVEIFSDADWGEDEGRKSNSGYICKINDGTISWSCRKQQVVAASSMESEYIALAETCMEIAWLRKIAEGLDMDMPRSVIVKSDSQSCISAIKNQKFSNRTKHIDVKYHFTRDQVDKGIIQLEYCPTERNVADILTKPLGKVKINTLRKAAGLDRSGGAA